MTIQEELRGFIATDLGWEGSVEELTDEYPLLDNGVLDSVGIFHVIGFIESKYGVDVEDEELVPEHFGTLAGIARLVESKRS
jgi:acyl carrier protein